MMKKPRNWSLKIYLISVLENKKLVVGFWWKSCMGYPFTFLRPLQWTNRGSGIGCTL